MACSYSLPSPAGYSPTLLPSGLALLPCPTAAGPIWPSIDSALTAMARLPLMNGGQEGTGVDGEVPQGAWRSLLIVVHFPRKQMLLWVRLRHAEYLRERVDMSWGT